MAPDRRPHVSMKRGQDSRSLASLSSVSQPPRSTSSVCCLACRTRHADRTSALTPCCVSWQASICTVDMAHTSTSSAAGKRVPARVTRQQAARQRELEACLLQSSQSPSSDDESDDELETFELDHVDEPAALSSRDLACGAVATCACNYRREIHEHLRQLEREVRVRVRIRVRVRVS